jgi:hypothetical protein
VNEREANVWRRLRGETVKEIKKPKQMPKPPPGWRTVDLTKLGKRG